MKKVLVRLLDEGVEVYRPVTAAEAADGTYVLGGAPAEILADEKWEFPPGSQVIVERRTFEGATELVAVGLYEDRSKRGL
jgi:hypothetical protein